MVLHVLPPPGQPGWDQNDNSVGLLVEYGTFRLLLAGDAEGHQWEWWLQEAAALLQPVHVHKASHHGSRNGDTAAALKRLRPEVVVIGVGAGNQYGHPNLEALALYQSQGATVYRTDQHGTVVVEAQRSGQYRIAVERGQGARPPPTATTPPPAGRCVDVNTATADDLQRIIHIGPVGVQEIIGLRRTCPFRSVQELTRVRGIAEIRLRDIVRQGLACVGSQ